MKNAAFVYTSPMRLYYSSGTTTNNIPKLTFISPTRTSGQHMAFFLTHYINTITQLVLHHHDLTHYSIIKHDLTHYINDILLTHYNNTQQTSLVPRPSHHPVFYHLQYAKMEGLVHFITWMTERSPIERTYFAQAFFVLSGMFSASPGTCNAHTQPNLSSAGVFSL